MKKNVRFQILVVLETVALEIGAYMYAALQYEDRQNVLLATGILCLAGGIFGVVLTRPKPVELTFAILLFGILLTGIGLYSLIILRNHESAYTLLGIGILCLLSEVAAILALRSIVSALVGVMVLGIVLTSVGIYFLTILGYHGRAYMPVGTGVLCVLAALVGIIIAKAHTTVNR